VSIDKQDYISHIVINENNDINNKGINFNYSESFIRIVELTSDNYLSWKNNMLYLLTINNLENYVIQEKVKILKKRHIRDDINDYIDDKFDNTLVYDKETNLLDIKNDIIVKWILLNTLGERTKRIVEGQGKTAYQIWNTLEKSFTSSLKKRKQELNDKISNLKFNEDQDINIFMATLQNTIEEYENIDHDIEDSIKAGILKRELPENLRFINVFQYKDNWGRLSNYVKDVIPDIIFSNMKEHTKIEDSQKHIFLTEQNTKSNNRKVKSSVKYKAKNERCYMCGRFGHYINECSKYNRYKNNKYNKHTKPRRIRYKNSKKGPRKDSFKYKKRNNQLNSMESTNSYSANTLSKYYNTEDTSFIGCISTEDNTVLPSNDHLENFNSFTISN